MKQFKELVLFLIGGITYFIIEILWRSYSHISMFILGGICFVLIGLINKGYNWNMKLWKQQLIAVCIITFCELVAGLILNIWFRLNIWNYSNMPFNFLGQICLGYSLLWFVLSVPAIILDDYLRYWIFGEEKPFYRVI